MSEKQGEYKTKRPKSKEQPYPDPRTAALLLAQDPTYIRRPKPTSNAFGMISTARLGAILYREIRRLNREVVRLNEELARERGQDLMWIDLGSVKK